jgi:hypothetical protein
LAAKIQIKYCDTAKLGGQKLENLGDEQHRLLPSDVFEMALGRQDSMPNFIVAPDLWKRHR